jgi:hypothetical protein
MKTLRLREIYQPKPKGVKYTIYRGEKPAAFHDSGIPMGTEMPRKAFMHGVPSKLINRIMDKLENEVPSEKFYTELEEGLPAKIATAAGISLAGDVVAKGVKKIAKKIKDDPKDADEELEEAPMGPLAKAAATAGAVASMAGGVAADPGAIPGTEPQANPEYNAPVDNTPVQKLNIKQYEKPIKQLAINFMKQQKYFSGIWPKGTVGPKILSSSGKIMMTTTEIGKNHIVLKTRYDEAWMGARPGPVNQANFALITIRFGEFSRGNALPDKPNMFNINKPSPTTITSVELDVLNDGGLDMARYAYKQFTGKVPHLSDQKFTKPGQMKAAGFYDLIGKDITKIK